MKRDKYIGFAMMAAGMFAATSCSDFSDYNDTPTDAQAAGVSTSSSLTLWENISSNKDLSDFAELVKRSGFNTKLAEPRAYTIWAPLNGTFTKSDYEQLNDSALLQRFVKNHIADYVHSATGTIDKRIHTLNDKSYSFEGADQSYTFANQIIAKPNQPSSNGIMHLMNGAAQFYPNLFEYLSEGENISELSNYFMQFNDTTLSDESVKGPMVNGVQTYLDSVLVVNNTLLRRLNAKLQNEDSSYTFVIPTDEAYRHKYDEIKPKLNYINSTKVLDPENFVSAATETVTKTVTTDAAYLADSLAKLWTVTPLIFSHNDMYNQWIVGKGENTDTLRSTTRSKFSNPDEILNQHLVGQPVELSNGYARIVDSLAFYPWETYNMELPINPRYYLANKFASTIHAQALPDSLVERVFGPDSKESDFRYYWIEPNGPYAKPDFFVWLPSVLSTTYNIYVVYMPTAIRQLGNQPLPSILNFSLNYCNAKGNLETYNFSKKFVDSGAAADKNPKTLSTATAFMNNPEKTDTVFIGQFTFPISYRGFEYNEAPCMRITTPFNPFSATDKEKYTRDVRIAYILLKPVELDQFEANKQ